MEPEDFLLLAEKFVKNLVLDFYNKRRSVAEMLAVLADDCSWIASGRQEFFTSKQEAVAYFEKQEAAQEVPYLHVDGEEFHGKLLTPEIALVYGRYHCYAGSALPMIDEWQRCSYVVRYCPDTVEHLQVCHIHVSNPWYLMRGTELFPKAVFSEMDAELVRELTKEKLPQEIELSTQQEKVLALLSLGLTYEDIAKRMQISVRTVRYHVEQIINKFYVTSRQELLLRYLRYVVHHKNEIAE